MKIIKAKNFILKDSTDEFFNLFKYQGKSRLLLVFFRGEWCVECRKQLSELNKNFDWFKKRDIKIVALSADDALFTSIIIEIIRPKYPILSDNKWKIFKLYGFKKPSNEKKIRPGLFFIDQKHNIEFKHIGKNYLDRLTISQLKKIINERLSNN